MDNLFFIASKTVGMVVRAESWLVLGLILTLLFVWRNRRGAALVTGTITLTLMLALTIWPLGDLVLEPLEAQYPANPPMTDVTGIIVLGGVEKTGPWRRWGGTQLSEGAERVIAGVTLAARFPKARLIFTGGEAALGYVGDTRGPSSVVQDAWLDLGVAPDRILLEQASRNTVENARLTYDLVQPKPGETYVLVTSAFHMPRSMQSFANAGWKRIVAWPVDFRSGDLADGAGWRLDDHLSGLDIALKEYLGLLVYQATGR